MLTLHPNIQQQYFTGLKTTRSYFILC